MKMKKSFTLVELLVTIGIIILLTTASLIPVKIHQDKANLDAAVIQIKSAVLKTQNYAFAPEREDIGGYAFVLNTSQDNQNYYGTTIEPRSYGIFALPKSGGLNPPTRPLVNPTSLINIPVNLESFPSYYSPSDLFQIIFRAGDGVAGCDTGGSLRYYDNDTLWPLCVAGGVSDDYAYITISYANREKRIRINKISGQMEICIPQASGDCQVI